MNLKQNTSYKQIWRGSLPEVAWFSQKVALKHVQSILYRYSSRLLGLAWEEKGPQMYDRFDSREAQPVFTLASVMQPTRDIAFTFSLLIIKRNILRFAAPFLKFLVKYAFKELIVLYYPCIVQMWEAN